LFYRSKSISQNNSQNPEQSMSDHLLRATKSQQVLDFAQL